MMGMRCLVNFHRTRGQLLCRMWSIAEACVQVKHGSSYDPNKKYYDPGYVHHSPGEDIQFPIIALHHFLWSKVKDKKRRTAVQCGVTGKRYTYWELKEFSRRLASALTKMGFKRGETLAMVSENLPEYMIVVLGTISTGGTVATIHPNLTPSEMAKQFLHAAVSTIVTSKKVYPKIQEVSHNLRNQIKNVIIIGDRLPGCYSLEDMLEDDGNTFPRNVTFHPKEDICMIKHSSGTTGVPKGVMLSHYNLVCNIMQTTQSDSTDIKETTEEYQDVFCCALPLNHIYPMVSIVLTGMSMGVKIVTLPGFKMETFLRAVKEYKPTYLHLVPGIMITIAKQKNLDKDLFQNIHATFCTSAPLGSTVAEQFRQAIRRPDMKIVEEYGMTETGPIVLRNPITGCEVNSVGVCVPNTFARVVDVTTGKNLGPEKSGELVVLGPQVMKGYLNNPEATNKMMFDDKWLRTGDLVRYNEAGHFYVMGRLKEILKVNDEQVSPAEIEDLIRRHPNVVDVVVIGIPDEEFGELPRAYIVRSDNSLTERDVNIFLMGKLAEFKYLKGGIDFVDKIPRTTNGKISRKQLRSLFMESKEIK